MVRETINALFAMIGAESLTDNEFNSLTITVFAFDQTTYADLSAVLASREAISLTQERLTAYFVARGATITAIDTGKSNIFLGSVL